MAQPLSPVRLTTASYLHHSVELTPELELARVSPPFFIDRRNVEFNSGLFTTEDGVELWFGAVDARSGRVRVIYPHLEDLLSSGTEDAARPTTEARVL